MTLTSRTAFNRMASTMAPPATPWLRLTAFALMAGLIAAAPQAVRADEPADQTEETDTDTDKDEKKTYPEPRRDCMSVRFLNNYKVIDRRHALFFESRSRPYLVTFASSCFGLRSSFQIKTASRTGEICGFAGERIIVGRGATAERCLVRSVERVESEEAARYWIAKRAGEDHPDEAEDDTDHEDDADGEDNAS